MPLLDLNKSTNFLRPLVLQSLMLYPQSKDERRRFLELGCAKLAEDTARSYGVELDATTRLLMLDKGQGGGLFESFSDIETLKRTKTSVPGEKEHPARIAGLMLWIPMLCVFRYGRDDIGRHQAIRLVSSSKRSGQDAWSKYASVAHLYAANEFVGLLEPEFLPLAESIAAWATSFVPKRSNAPLIDVDRWMVLPSADLGAEYLQALAAPFAFGEIWRNELHLDGCKH